MNRRFIAVIETTDETEGSLDFSADALFCRLEGVVDLLRGVQVSALREEIEGGERPDLMAALRFSAMALESAAQSLEQAKSDVAAAMPEALRERAREARAAIAQAERGASCPIPAPPLPLAASILAEIEAVRAEIATCVAGEARNPDDEGWQNMAATARERMAGLARIAAAAGVTIPAEAGK